MSIADDVKDTLEADTDLMALLTGGVFAGVEEIDKQMTDAPFDENGEILPCALIKLGTEIKSGPYNGSVQLSLRIYFYQYSGYDVIEPAMDIVFNLLNEKQIGDGVWNIEYSNSVLQQRDSALDCALGLQVFNVIRNR